MSRRALMLTGTVGAAVAAFSFLFLPFVGFSETLEFGTSSLYRDVSLAGIGTYGEEANFFEYAEVLWVVQLALLLVGLGMVVSFVLALRARDPSTAAQPPGMASAILAMGSVAAVVLLLATLLGLFPMVEDDPIWNTELEGWISDWWPGFGGILGVLSAGVAAWALRPKALTGGAGRAPSNPVAD